MNTVPLTPELTLSLCDEMIEKIQISLPACIEFKPAFIGTGVFSKQPFQAGGVMYDATSILIPNKESTITLSVLGGKEFILNSFTHAVELSPTVRELFPYDSFMNHSCEANSFMRYVGKGSYDCKDSSGRVLALHYHTYQMVAIREIHPGEEITCNYSRFDYRCHGHEIVACCCGALDCCKVVGFSFLSPEQQLSLLQDVTESVRLRYYLDHPELLQASDEQKELLTAEQVSRE